MRLIGLVVLTLGLTLATLAAEAQQAARPRVGVVTQSSANYDAFLQVLREAGCINGQNITVELRTGFGQREQVPKIVAEILALKVDVIVAGSPLVIAAFKNATTTIPIVANDFESDPVARGFVASFARPGRNITGVFLDLPELAGKQLQFLKETAPGLARVAVLWDPDIGEHQLQATKNAARSAGLSLEPLGVVKAGDFAPAFDRAVRARAQAVVVLTSPIMVSNRRQIAELALKYRLPTISPFIVLPEAGALMAYGPSHPEIFRRLASYVDKILRGANPGDLPLERPSKFELVINMKTAKALGLTIPQSVLGRADQIIE